MKTRLLTGIAIVVLGLPLLGVMALWSGQEHMIFPGPAADVEEVKALAGAAGARLVELSTPDGERLLTWHEDRGASAALLYFHGNGSICDRPPAHRDMLERRGISYVCIAYRGYPGSTGQPSETGLHIDALTAWNWVTGELGVQHERVFIHGRSLGGGVAARLALKVRAGGLILESTFRSVTRIAQANYPGLPVGALLRHPFDTESIAEQLALPTLVLHGDLDRVIPVSHGRWLGTRIPAARYVEAPGHHHNSGLLTQYPAARAAYERFLDENRDAR